MIKTFTSYHHANDQQYKEALVSWAESAGIIENISVNIGDIDENLPSQTIRRMIRDNYLMDSEVTVLLCGTETRYRKHVDWELKSSMIDGTKNRQSGILVIDLPTTSSTSWHVCSGDAEKKLIYPDYTGGWTSVTSQDDYEQRYPEMPRRIIENLVEPNVRISIVPWDRVFGFEDRFKFLIENAARNGKTNEYNLDRKMRMKNYNPRIDQYDIRV